MLIRIRLRQVIKRNQPNIVKVFPHLELELVVLVKIVKTKRNQ